MKLQDGLQTRGSVLIAFAAMMQATSQALFKVTSQKQGVSATQLAAIRALSQGLFVVLPSMIWQRVPLLPRRREAPRMISVYIVARGFLGGANFLMAVWVVMYLPLGDGQALQDMYPVLTAPLAWFFLGEELLKVTAPALLLSIVGILFITQPPAIFGGGRSEDTGSSSALVGTICGVACSLTMAVKFILARKAKDAHTLQLVVWMNMFQVIIGISCCVVEDEFLTMPDLKGWLQIFAIVSTNLCYLFAMTCGQQIVPAAFASILMSTDIVWSYIFQIVFFRKAPSTFTLGGVSLIVLANCLMSFGQVMQRGACADRIQNGLTGRGVGSSNHDQRMQVPIASTFHPKLV